MGQKEAITRGLQAAGGLLRWASRTGNWLGAIADDSVHVILASSDATCVGVELFKIGWAVLVSRLRWCETTLSTKALTTPVSLQLSGNSLRSALSTSPLNWRVAYLQSFPLSSQRPLTMFTPAWAAAMPAVCLPQPAVGGRVGHVGGRVGGRVAGVGRFNVDNAE